MTVGVSTDLNEINLCRSDMCYIDGRERTVIISFAYGI